MFPYNTQSELCKYIIQILLWCQPILTASLASDLQANKNHKVYINVTSTLVVKLNHEENTNTTFIYHKMDD